MIENRQDSSRSNQLQENSMAGREFFARWLHRKQENELGQRVILNRGVETTKEIGSASRFSRLLHRLELKPEERGAKLHQAGRAVLGGEMRINHRGEFLNEQSEIDSDNIEEAVFDIRHEELDHAMPTAQSTAVKSADDETDDKAEEMASTRQQTTAISNILADKSYAPMKEPTVPIVEETPNAMKLMKAHKTYIIYGFVAGIAVVAVLVLVSL